jgi:MG2 domain/Alpha-2-macroglobulin bait region domain
VNGEQYVSTGLLPTDKPVIQLILDDEIDVKALSEDARTKGIYLENSNKERVNCILSNPLTNLPEYEGSPKYVEKPNTKMLKCSIEQKLPTKTKYRLVIEQKVYTGLKQAWGQDMETPPDFVISDIVPASATEICVYSSTPLPALYGANAFTGITVSPKARLKEVSSYVRYDNNGNTLCPSRAVSSKMEMKESPKSTNALEKILQPPTVASQQEENLVASLIDIRMLGEKEYTLGFSTVFKDMYNNPLTKDYSKKILSPALKRKDSYVFFMPEKEYQTIPASAPIRLPLQTVNASQVFVEVCAISPSELASYQRENYRYVPNCSKPAIKKAIQTKNLGWDTSSIQVDLSDGFFPDNTYPGDILFVRGSLDADQWTHEWPEQRDFKGVYMRSNIALGIVSGNEKSIVFATEYDGKTVPSDVTFSFQGCMRAAPADLPKWNKDKQYYEMKGNFSGADGCILVASGASGVGYVSTNVDATSNYDFGQVGGLETSTRDFAYTYTDRPMYRAGDTIYFKGILRSFVPTGYTKSATKNVKLRILQDDWTEVTTIELPVSANGNFSGEFNLPKEMKTGRHFFEISDKDTTSFIVNDAVFFVEQYSKPVFKTTVKNTETNAMMGDTIKANAQASYYFGGALPGAKVEWTVRSQNYFFDPKDYSQYRFGADSDLMDCIYWGSCSTSDMLIGASVGTLNETGIASYDFTPDFTVANTADTPEYDKVLPKEKIVSYTAQVTDPNTGKTVSATDSTIFHTTDGYVGIQSPYWTTKGEALKVSGIVLDHGAKPMAKSKVTLEYIKTEWLLANKTGVDGYGYDDYTQKKTLAHSEELISGDNGEWRNEWMPTDGGQYILRATYTGKNGKKFVSESYAYVSTDSYMMWNNGNATVTELVGEKALYKPGETAVFTLKTPVNSGKFLVTVEKDDAILDSFVRDVTSFGEKIEIPVKKEYLPNVYVRVYVIGADSTKGLPVYKRALSQFRVATGDQALDVKLTTKKPKYLPGEGLEVEVSVLDMAGKPVSNANGSIAVVDQSVLALAGNPKKNPFAFFYEMKRYLGTTFFSSLTYLVEKIEVKNTANGEKGGAGDGNKGGDTKKKRGVFKDTAYWQAEFTTNSE